MILVMMSTYNGEKYLREQIESILNQTEKNKILIRDDGSTDSTLSIIKEYEKKEGITWYQGKNIGPTKSFFDLLIHAPNEEYYAFSDQDDYWMPDKLKAGVDHLKKIDKNIPALYYSGKLIVNEKLEKINTKDIYVRKNTFGCALTEGVAYGCTMVFNYKLKKIISGFIPENKYMHDAFIYRLSCSIGIVIYDPNSYIRYRQHSSNVVGHEEVGLQRWKQRLKHLPDRKNEHSRSGCAADIFKYFGQYLKKEDRQLAYYLSKCPYDFYSRLRVVLDKRFVTQHPLNIFFLKIFVLFGWI